MKTENLLEGLPTELPEELFTTILQTDGIRIERIVSRGHASPSAFWYDQEESEFIVLLQGAAAVQLEGEAEPVELRPGCCLNLSAHVRHRVVRTDAVQPTVWLAIHYRSDAASAAPRQRM